MANVITPSVSELYYIIVENGTVDTVRSEIQKLQPGTSLIDNSDGLIDIDGTIRGNAKAAEVYLISNLIDINNHIIPDWSPSEDGSEDYTDLQSNQLDYLLIIYRDYYTVNTPSDDFQLNLQGSTEEPNEPLNNGSNNQYLLEIQALFTSQGYIFSILTN